METPMWSEPYLETCCRSALHRLTLAGGTGRPAELADAGCLKRLAGLGLAVVGEDGRFVVTPDGVLRHRSEILRT
jgi:hypothetical protein